jgi:hypothetical protein
VYVDLGSGVIGLLFIDQISKARLAPEDLDNIFAEGDKIMASRFRRVGCMGKVAKQKVCMPHAGCSVYTPVCPSGNVRYAHVGSVAAKRGVD